MRIEEKPKFVRGTKAQIARKLKLLADERARILKKMRKS